MNVTANTTIGEVPEHEEDYKTADWAWGDVSDKTLGGQGVKKARQEEMSYIEKMGVWEKMDREEAVRQGYKIVGTRWIDTDKGDETNPLYRSILVGQEYNTGSEEGLYASTPPHWRHLGG